MAKPLKLERVSYVLRVWVEFLNQAPSQLRGEIEHVESNQKKYFSKIEDIQEFIETSAGKDTAKPGGGLKNTKRKKQGVKDE